MDVSIIVVNYNTRELLDRCLASIRQHTVDIAYEIIVVDNASEDGSQNMIRVRYPEARLIEQSKNKGFAYANNRGINMAQGQAVFLLNSDTEFTHNAVKILYNGLFSSDRIGACGGLLVYPGGTPQWSYGYYPSLRRMLWITVSGLLHVDWGRRPGAVVPDDLRTARFVEYITGAGLMIKKEALDKVGLLDENFFAYFEETDLCLRIHQAGYEIVLQPEARIIHRIEGSFRDQKRTREIIFYTSMFKYFEKHYGSYRWVKAFLQWKFTIIRFLSYKGSYRHEDAVFRGRVISECTSRYPFSF